MSPNGKGFLDCSAKALVTSSALNSFAHACFSAISAPVGAGGTPICLYGILGQTRFAGRFIDRLQWRQVNPSAVSVYSHTL